MSAELKWSADEIADACVKAGLGILECHGLMVTLKATAPAQGALTDAQPDLPSHPEKYHVWTEQERKAIEAYGQLCRGQVSDAADAATAQWWLAEVDQYGNATLIDGMHRDRAGADQAAFLFDQMGFSIGRNLAVAKVELSEPKPSAKGVNMEAVAQCNSMAAAIQAQAGDAPSGEAA